MNRQTLNGYFVAIIVVLAALVAIAATSMWAAEQNASAAGEKYLLKERPKVAGDVVAVRNDAKDREEVVVIGRIGGRKNPWVKGAAAFSIVDRSLTPCNEIPGDTCPTPWDYCCETNLPKATLLVVLQDEAGKMIKKDARKLLGVKELDTVVVQGRAKRDRAGNVTIVAAKVYVAPEKKNEEETAK